MKYQLTLKNQSLLLTGSGEGSTLIDSDVVFHPTGFPYIPARRVKGMLKESLEEVMEISGETEPAINTVVSSLFGEGGAKYPKGKLISPNLYLSDWDQITGYLSELEASDPLPDPFFPDFIKAHFTIEVQQTAIGDDGIAEDHSLRNYRVLKPELSFENILTADPPLSSGEEAWLQKAANNLRYAGTRRNRGFGKVNCTFRALPLEEGPNTEDRPDVPEASPFTSLTVKIETCAPVVLALQLGDQNTVFTQKQISGNHLRGLLASAFIKRKGLQRENAHNDDLFKDIFLSGKVHFGYLSFQGSQPIPLHIHYFKGHKGKPPVSVFDMTEEHKELVTKPLNYFGKVGADGNIEKEEPQTTFFFHNSRQIRSAGRSKKEQTEGGIFYYEALNERQSFHGEITGDVKVLQALEAAFPSPFPARLGKSKSAQYSQVRVILSPKETDQTTDKSDPQNGEYLLTLQSPLVLHNEWGIQVADTTILIQYLSRVLGVSPEDITLKNAAARATIVEQFNAVWQSKSGRFPVFKEGSSFLLNINNVPAETIALTELGELVEQGFGKVKLEPFDRSVIFSLTVQERPSEQTPVSTPEPNNELLKEILRHYECEQEELKVMAKAIHDSRKLKGKLNNHLIGRLERLLERSTNEETIKRWIAETKGKPAGDALQRTGLVDDDHKFKLNKTDSGDFTLNKRYWLTFFRTLRKLNKK